MLIMDGVGPGFMPIEFPENAIIIQNVVYVYGYSCDRVFDTLTLTQSELLCSWDLLVDGTLPRRNTRGRFRVLLGLRRWQSEIDVLGGDTGRFLVIFAVNVVSILKDGDLVASQRRHLVGNQSRSSSSQVSVSKDDVDFGEFSTGSFGVEYPDDGEEDTVGDSEEQEGVCSNRGSHGGQDLDDQEVEKPVAHGGDGVGLGSNGLRVQFGRIQPRERKPSGTEEGDEEVETEGGTLRRALGAGKKASESDEHGDSLSNGADQEHRSSTTSFNEEE